jgi:hypothetical protein
MTRRGLFRNIGSHLFAEYIRDGRNEEEEAEENLFCFYDVCSNFLISVVTYLAN